MKIVIVQFDDRDVKELGVMQYLILRNAAYAKKHNYDHVFLQSINADIPPFWAKVFLASAYMAAGYDMVVWLDSDAVIHDDSKTLEEFFAGEQAFGYAPDNPLWGGPFNAGVFFCKGASAKELLTAWMSHYNPSMWEKIDGKWRCKSPAWSGPEYEQGAFIEKILPAYADTGLLKKYDWEEIQSPYPLANSFILHFASIVYKYNIPIYLNTKSI
jgi:hypothetical protein